jgi:predicted ATPase/class 3 adenylate cyclase
MSEKIHTGLYTKQNQDSIGLLWVYNKGDKLVYTTSLLCINKRMESSNSFGHWIRRQRKALDLTQQLLAERVGCSIAAIKKIESDERRPSRPIAQRLADVLGVPASQREVFLGAARGLYPVDKLSLAHEPQALTPSRGSASPTGTVTFLYTDIEGSTQLWKQHRQAMAAAYARHDQILRESIESNNGYVFQVVGDAFCAAFYTAVDAVQAAINSQVNLQAEKWGEAPIRVRMGIHSGKAELQQDGLYSGFVTLSHVQRLMSVAHGGQVLLSFTAQELLQDELPENVELRDMGQRQLKDWSRPEHIFQLVIPGLPADFPPLSTPESFPHNLPVQLTSFIGRERERVEIKQLLSNVRLLTLTGSGGTGKTRLALQIAEEHLPSYAAGVWFVELVPLTDGSLISQTIASIFGLRELPNLPILDIITDYLRAKQLLLILDNCEHLVEACAILTDHLLHSCPQLKVIATSREALDIAGETVYQVPSLSWPSQIQVTRQAAMGFESVQLFAERASAVNPKFNLTEENASDVAQICRHLDGIPLALELAAARSSIFSPKEIASRLDDRFRLLTGGSRAALERHQTLRALIDWSYDLLSDEERALLRQLSVFAGGWTFEAAEAVCPDLNVLTLLTQLVKKSLVIVDGQESSTRYYFLETIRQYAHDKLIDVGELEDVRNRHLEFFLKFVQKAESHFNSLDEEEWMSRLEVDDDNLRAALEWAMENDVVSALRLGTALYLFWSRHGYESEGRRLLSETLARLTALPPVEGEAAYQRIALRAKALNAFAVLGYGTGDFVGSLKVFEESIQLSRQIGDKYTLSFALSSIGMVKAFLGDAESSYHEAEEGLALARETGDKVLVGLALITMAGVTLGDPKTMRAYSEEGLQLLREAGARWAAAMTSFGAGLFAAWQGNHAEAHSWFEACLPLFTELRDTHRVTMVHSELAHLERRQGHFSQAKALYRETLLAWHRMGHRAAIAHEMECLAIIAKAQEEDEGAARLFGAAEALRETINIPMTPFERMEYEREVSDLRANMDEAAFVKAWTEGRAMTMEQAIVFALES